MRVCFASERGGCIHTLLFLADDYTVPSMPSSSNDSLYAVPEMGQDVECNYYVVLVLVVLEISHFSSFACTDNVPEIVEPVEYSGLHLTNAHAGEQQDDAYNSLPVNTDAGEVVRTRKKTTSHEPSNAPAVECEWLFLCVLLLVVLTGVCRFRV